MHYAILLRLKATRRHPWRRCSAENAPHVRDFCFRLIGTTLAESMLGWRHSGFSAEASTGVCDDAARQSPSQYIVRAPVGLEKLTRDREEDTLSWKAPETGHWQGDSRHFDSQDFIAQVTLHITLAPLACAKRNDSRRRLRRRAHLAIGEASGQAILDVLIAGDAGGQASSENPSAPALVWPGTDSGR